MMPTLNLEESIFLLNHSSCEPDSKCFFYTLPLKMLKEIILARTGSDVNELAYFLVVRR